MPQRLPPLLLLPLILLTHLLMLPRRLPLPSPVRLRRRRAPPKAPM